jgi:O-antigen ligase
MNPAHVDQAKNISNVMEKLNNTSDNFWAKASKLSGKFESISLYMAVATAFCIPLSTSLTNVLFSFIVITSLAAGNWHAKAKLLFRNPVVWFFLAFFVLFVVGLTYTTAPISEALDQVKKYDKFLFAIFFLPLFATERVRNYAIYAFLSAVLIMLVASYLKAFGLIQYSIANGGPVEIFKGHIEFSFLLAFAAYLIMNLLLDQAHYRLFLSIFLLLIMFNLFFMGYGRSGYFVFICLVGLLCLQRIHGKHLIFAIVGIIVFVTLVGFFSNTVKDRFTAVFKDIHTYQQDKNSETSMGLRIGFVKNSLQLIKKHPIFGTGTGSLRVEYAKLTPTPKFLTKNPHNEYLNITVQFGIVGLLLLLSMFGYQLWLSKQLPINMRYFVQAVTISIMLGCLANSWLMDTTEGHFYAYFMILTFAALKRSAPTDKYNKQD